MSEDAQWGADVPVSIPMSPIDPHAEKVDLGGFAFTPTGLAFDLTEVDLEAMMHAPYGPDEVSGG